MKIWFDNKLLIAIIVASCMLSIAALGRSPMNIPIHFSGGQADQFVNKFIGLFLFPVLMVFALFMSKRDFKFAWAIYFFFLLHLYLLYHAVMY